MKVYHGSYVKIRKIDIELGRYNTDFGHGFYVTKFLHHAKDKAVREGQFHDTEGVVTEFDFKEVFAKSICQIKCFEGYTEEWLDFEAMNRDDTTHEKLHPYDIVEGPVADDKIQHRIKKYLKGEITKKDFLNQVSHSEETHQICFCTVNSLQTLVPIESDIDITSHVEDIGEPLLEALVLNLEISEAEAADRFYLSNTFMQLADTSTGLYLKSWQEIYEMLKLELGEKKFAGMK
jgi:hypothetical protein